MKNSRQKDLPFRYYDLLWAVPGEHRATALRRAANGRGTGVDRLGAPGNGNEGHGP